MFNSLLLFAGFCFAIGVHQIAFQADRRQTYAGVIQNYSSNIANRIEAMNRDAVETIDTSGNSDGSKAALQCYKDQSNKFMADVTSIADSLSGLKKEFDKIEIELTGNTMTEEEFQKFDKEMENHVYFEKYERAVGESIGSFDKLSDDFIKNSKKCFN